jgi:hypothetical protein
MKKYDYRVLLLKLDEPFTNPMHIVHIQTNLKMLGLDGFHLVFAKERMELETDFLLVILEKELIPPAGMEKPFAGEI